MWQNSAESGSLPSATGLQMQQRYFGATWVDEDASQHLDMAQAPPLPAELSLPSHHCSHSLLVIAVLCLLCHRCFQPGLGLVVSSRLIESMGRRAISWHGLPCVAVQRRKCRYRVRLPRVSRGHSSLHAQPQYDDVAELFMSHLMPSSRNSDSAVVYNCGDDLLG